MIRRFVSLICLILFAAGSDISAQPIRVMSFNILYGGEQRGEPLEQTAAVIKAGRADIVGLQEMIGPAPAEGEPRPIQARHLADMLGWYYVDQENNTCGIISRYKITGSTPGKWGAAIELPDGRKLHVFNVHFPSTPYQPYQLLNIPYYGGAFLSTADEAIEVARAARGRQVDAMLAEVKEFAAESDAVFVVGDFNEPSHLDWTDETAEAGKCPLPVAWPATRAMTDAGFIDAYRAVFPNPVTHPGNTWTPTTAIDDPRDHHDRIDFVFARGEGIRITSAMVVGESERFADAVVTPYPSDHRAVVAEIVLPESTFTSKHRNW